MQLADSSLFADTFYLGIYAAIYDPVSTFTDKQSTFRSGTLAIELDEPLKPFLELLGYIYRSRDFALTIPDPDTVLAMPGWQIANVEVAQLRSTQTGIDQ